jgi:proline dehydrogenase
MDPMKEFFLFLSRQKSLHKMLSSSGPFCTITRRFVSGDTIEEGVKASKELNQKGVMVSLDCLGESVLDEKMADAVVQEYLKIIAHIKTEELFKISVSLKLTQLGMDIGKELCLENLRRILQKAKDHHKLVTIDMEDTPYTDRTIDIYKTMLSEGYKGTGIVIQSYLRRTENDIKNMLPLGPRVRLCKGAYKEPATMAFPDKKDVDKNYLNILSILLSKESLGYGTYPEVASHDEKIINWTLDYVKKNNIAHDKFEFQMLYGIRRDLQEKLAGQGYRIRAYVPYGTHCYPYFMRRLAERPANVLFMAKNMLYR